MIHIDGALMEGGGQLLRNASAYACILGVDIHIRDIRRNRSVPGLNQQHLNGLRLLTEITEGLLEGGQIGSSEIILRPGKRIVRREFNSNSIKLIFQSALPVLLFAKHQTKLVLRGNTDDEKTPPIDYTKFIFLPFLKKHFGIDCTLEVHKRGVSSLGEGEVSIIVNPVSAKLNCISLLERGDVVSFTGIIWNAKEDYKMLSTALEQSVKQELRGIDTNPVLTFIRSPPTTSSGGALGILLYAETSSGHFISASAMLEVLSSTEEEMLVHQATLKGAEVVRKLAKQLTHGGLVDNFLADQIVIFLALASSGVDPSLGKVMDLTERRRCEVLVGEVSLHTLTTMKIAEIMLRNIMFSTEKIEGVGTVIICENKAGRSGGPGDI